MASTVRTRATAGPPEKGRWLRTEAPYGALSDYSLAIVRYSKIMAVIPFPNGPSQLSIVEHFASSIDFTLGDIPKREHSEPRSWSISIAGRTGTADKHSIDTREGRKTTSAMQPMNILREFEDFLDTYQQWAKDDGAMVLSDEVFAFTPANHTSLLFHAWKEEKHFFVELGKYSYDRAAATSRNSAEWSLTLEAWAPQIRKGNQRPGQTFTHVSVRSYGLWNGPIAKRDLQTLAAASATTRGILTDQTGNALSAAERVLQYGASASNLARLAELKALIPKEIPGSGQATFALARLLEDAGYYQTALLVGEGMASAQELHVEVARYQRAVQHATQYATDVADLALVPVSTLCAIVATAFSLRQAAAALVVVPQAYGAFGESAFDVLRSIFDAAYVDAVTALGRAGGSPADYPKNTPEPASAAPHPYPSAGASTMPVGDGPKVGAGYVVPAGVSSWKQLATHIFGSPDYWLTLALLNGAKDGYSDESGGPIYAGKIVTVPFGAVSNQTGKAISLDAIFGVDFAEGPDGDWVYEQPGNADIAAGGSDIQIVSGVSNLQQGLLNRMTTPLGSIPAFGNYGLLHAAIGEAVTDKVATWAALDIRQQMLEDERLADVQQVKILFQDTAWHISFVAVPVGPQPDKIAVMVPLASLG